MESAGRYAYEGLDRLLHEKARLGIMTSLLTHPDGLPFNDLKLACALTDGNLSRHLQALSRAGLVESRKDHEGGRPQTICRLSPLGRQRFLEYLEELERVLRDVAGAAHSEGREEPRSSSAGPRGLEGWAPA
jgi:DNA-binding transcriptional ArsR family regulator